jgi:osmotically inducible protein OsmC
MSAQRMASTTWEGDLAHGAGTLRLASGATGDLPVTWASRTERSDGKTSPEELIAAAHASCFSMALANGLTEGGNPPDSLQVQATVTLDTEGAGPRISSSHITVRGAVPGLDQAAFEAAAKDAGQNCPVSAALRASLAIEVEATLES